MKIGTRILYPEETDMWKGAELVQISAYSGIDGNLDMMIRTAEACTIAGLPFVVHPVGYSVLNEDTCDDIISMAKLADIALILHDERGLDGGRISRDEDIRLRRLIEEMSAYTRLSFENARNTADVQWFWDNYADSITLDIGHVQAYGLDSLEFVQALDSRTIEKIEFVHIHMNNGIHGGIRDHWPITPDCREVLALKELL
ncbi:hypothetical protein H8E50_04960, partial [bacterium]|nr:hypothetical protein [bacterium]